MNGKYEHFGVMMDVSRNGVMKVSQVKRMIDYLQKMGYNSLELYCEDTYEIEDEPYFGYMRGRYTGTEIKEIDAYAKERGIELIPCIQTLGHFSNLVRHEVYQNIVDVNDILLVGEPATYTLIEKIFKTLSENFTSRNVNIGMDEAHLVGLGKYLDQHGYRNRFDILVEHLEKVAEIAKKYGFKAHMWSDMFFRLLAKGAYYAPDVEIPEWVKGRIPENVDLTYWDYYHRDKEVYDKMLDKHLEFGREIWFAGGAWSWFGFAPLGELTVRTMKPAMQSVLEKGIKNVFITVWGDDGKECSYFSLLHTLYAIRQYADGNFDEEKIAKGFYELFGVNFADFFALDLPNKYSFDDIIEWRKHPSKGLLYSDPFMGVFDTAVESRPTIPYAEYAKVLEKAKKRAGEFSYLFDMEVKLCRVLEIKAELGVKLRRAYRSGDRMELAKLADSCVELKKRIKAFHKAFYTVWDTENKPQGWEVQDIRLGGLIMRIETCRKRLEEYLAGKTNCILELEDDVLPANSQNQIAQNNYGRIVSFGLLHIGRI